MTTVTSNVFEAATLALGVPRYVATNGANTNPGTEAQPWRTIQYAVDNVSPGMTIYVRGGVYSERIVIDRTRGGTPGNYVTLRNYPGESWETGNGPIIDGSAFPTSWWVIYTSGVSYYKVIGLEMRNYYGGGMQFNSTGTQSHIEIRDNYIHDNTYVAPNGHAINITAVNKDVDYSDSAAALDNQEISDLIIDGNTLRNITSGAQTYNEAVTIAWTVNRFQVTNNTLDGFSHMGIDTLGKEVGYATTATSPTVTALPHHPRYGYIADNTLKNGGWLQTPYPYAGIYIDGAKDLVIEDNLIFDQVYSAILVGAEEPAMHDERIIIRHNKIRDCWQGIFASAAVSYQGPGAESNHIRVAHNSIYMVTPTTSSPMHPLNAALGDDVVMKNNIVQTLSYPAASGFNHYQGETYSPTLDYNLYYPSTTFWRYKNVAYLTWADYQANPYGQEQNSKIGNPSFTNPAADDFTLQVGSAAIDVGTPLTTAVGGDTSTTLVVADSRWFHDGMDIEGLAGDTIQVGLNTAVITDINHTTNTITLDTALTWSNDESVSYPWNSTAPDMGAHETS